MTVHSEAERSVDAPFIEMRGISIRFGGIHALKDASIDVRRGEIVALLGDNGAGKSTLIKALSGVYEPDAGQICVEGEIRRIRSPRDALGLGIETIYQSSSLADDLSVARNLFLGRERKKRLVGLLPRLDIRRMENESVELLKNMGLHRDVSPSSSIRHLSGGERQSIAIARAMQFDANLVILDEPTNNLGVEETYKVLQFMRDLKESGRSCLFVTHNLVHVFEVADRIIVMRNGRDVAERHRADSSIEEVEELITGMEPGDAASILSQGRSEG